MGRFLRSAARVLSVTYVCALVTEAAFADPLRLRSAVLAVTPPGALQAAEEISESDPPNHGLGLKLKWRNHRLFEQVYSNRSDLLVDGHPGGEFLKISELRWASRYPALVVDFDQLSDTGAKSDRLRAWIGTQAFGSSEPMVDLDWTSYGEGQTLTDPNYNDDEGYTFLTLSPDTRLDWAGGIDIQNRSFVSVGSPSAQVRLFGGSGLSVEAHNWTARGAEGFYSVDDYFDTPVFVPDTQETVRLQHWLASPYSTVGVAFQTQRFRVAANSRVGLNASFLHDDHVLRDLAIRSVGLGWMAGIDGSVEAVLSDQLDLIVSGDLSRAASYGLWRRNIWDVGSEEYPDGLTADWLRGWQETSVIDTKSIDWSIEFGLTYRF